LGVRGLDKGEKPALLISECQGAMTMVEYRDVRDDLARNVRDGGTIPAIARLADGFRSAGLPVVHSHLAPRSDWSGFSVHSVLEAVLKKTDRVRQGHPGSDSHPDLPPQPGDYLVRRPTGMTSFYGTEIDPLLRANGIDTVVIVGVSINVAVFGSTLEAVNRGYNVVVPTDCVAGVGSGAQVLLTDIYPVLATITDSAAVLGALSGSND
jgi:nicotinamidase-related amidase